MTSCGYFFITMTRKEQIEQASDEYIKSTLVGSDYFKKSAFKTGAEWADKTMIDKACEWLKKYRQDTYDGTGYIAGIVNDKTIEDFRKAMEK